MNIDISQSRFYMWRTLFAIVHADNVVTDEEVTFMAEALEDVAFTPEQEAILRNDIDHPKDVDEMFQGITDQDDRTAFFDFARGLVWVDGDFAKEEQNVIIRLSRQHYKRTNVDDLVGKVKLRFEDDYPAHKTMLGAEGKKKKDIGKALLSFRRRFLEALGQ